MSERGKGIVSQILGGVTESQITGSIATRNYQEVKIEEADKLPYFLQSFSTFEPVIKPLLQEIKDKHPVLLDLDEDQVQTRTFEPRVNEEYTQPGHFALIWRSYPEPRLAHFGAQKEYIEKFTSADEKLTRGKKISKRKKEKIESILSTYGNKKILLQGFNVIVVVADIANINGVITPVVKLITNSTEEEGSGFTLEDLDFEKQALIPALANALNPFGFMYGKWPFYPRVRTYVTEGPDKIMPTGPFV